MSKHLLAGCAMHLKSGGKKSAYHRICVIFIGRIVPSTPVERRISFSEHIPVTYYISLNSGNHAPQLDFNDYSFILSYQKVIKW